MREIYKFIVLTEAHVSRQDKEDLRDSIQDAELRFESAKKVLIADIVDDMVNYEYKGIIILGRVKAQYIADIMMYAREKIIFIGEGKQEVKGVHEKIYYVRDGKLISFWELAFGKKEEYSTELI